MASSQQDLIVSDGDAGIEDGQEEMENTEVDAWEKEKTSVQDDYQPLYHLKEIHETFSHHMVLLNEHTLSELGETGFLEEVHQAVDNSRDTYENCKVYVEKCIEDLHLLSAMQIALVKKYREKIEEESKEILTGLDDQSWKDWDEFKLRKTLDDTSKHERFASIARSIGDLQKFADDLAKAFNTLNNEIGRMTAEAQRIQEEEEQLRLEKEARIKFEEERKQKEEEERLRREDEEKTRQIEEKRKMEEEEEKRQKEEERIARREEEERKKKEEEEERKRRKKEEKRRLEEMGNPFNWEPHRFEPWNGFVNQEVVLRVPKDDFSEADVDFSIADQSNVSLTLGPDEELMSELTHMNVTSQEGLKYEVPAWLAFAQPFFPPGHRETVMKILTKNDLWEELPTRPAKIPTLTDSKYIEAPFEVLESTTIAVVNKLKVDTKHITNQETKFESSVDPRVRVICQKGSVRFNARIALTVFPVQTSTVDRVKEKYDEARQMLMSTGHLISIKPDRKIRVPVILNVPLPGGRKGKELPKVSRQGSALSARSEKNQLDSEDEHLFVAWKSQNKWHHTENPEVTYSKDAVSFEVDTNKMDRVLFMKLNRRECCSTTIASIASQIEECTRVTPVQMITKQKSNEKSSIYLQVCPAEYAERELATLQKNGYDTGPLPSAEVEIREGQKLMYNFSGNILPDCEEHIEFVFNCNLRNSMRELFIKEKDIFDQKSSEEYRGYAELWKQSSESDDQLLMRMPVTLPKVYSREENIPHRIPIPPPHDSILTEELLRTFSRELIDDWHKLARALKIKSSLLPGIRLQHADDEEEAVYKLLLTWYSRSGVMAHKADQLKSALKSIHRPDLAKVIEQGGEGWSKENRVWNEVFRQLTRRHVGVLKDWSSLFRLLVDSLHMESEVIIHNIRQQGKMDADCCNLALRKWREMGGSQATPYTLVSALKEIDNALAADDAEDIFKTNDMM